MKKLFVLAAAAFLFSGSAFACEGGKDGKKCKKDKSSCCSKDKKSCDKSSKEKKEKKTAKL